MNQGLIDFYFEKKCKGMDFSEIRKELKKRKLPDEEIKEMLQIIDDRIVDSLHTQRDKDEKNWASIIGIVLIFIGVVVTFYTFTWAEKSGSGDFIIFYGPIQVGLGFILAKPLKNSTFFKQKRRLGRFH